MNENNSIVLFSKCRACLNNSGNLKFLSVEDPDSNRLISMFTKVNNFEWINNDKLASHLCSECEVALEASYRFLQKCVESNEKIKKLLGEVEFEDFVQENHNNEFMIKEDECSEFTKENIDESISDDQQELKINHFKCICCDFFSYSKRALSIHIRHIHKEIQEKWCYNCNELFEELSSHKEVHKNEKGPKRYRCEICDVRFIHRSSMVRHYKRHKVKEVNEENSKNTQPETNNDNSQLSSKNRIKVQKLEDHSTQGRRHICHVCNKECQNKYRLNKHLRQHSGYLSFKCKYCNKFFAVNGHLIEHERIHTGEKPHICDFCGKGFAQRGTLRVHRRLHTGKPIICSICKKGFCRTSELRLHLTQHTGEKPYLCNICGKSFRLKGHLVEHSRTHSEDRPFTCKICNKAFKQKCLLTTHLQNHSGYKPYQCKLCPYAANKPYRLNQHMKQHSNELKEDDKIYLCRICNKSFGSKAVLNSHLSAMHDAIV